MNEQKLIYEVQNLSFSYGEHSGTSGNVIFTAEGEDHNSHRCEWLWKIYIIPAADKEFKA